MCGRHARLSSAKSEASDESARRGGLGHLAYYWPRVFMLTDRPALRPGGAKRVRPASRHAGRPARQTRAAGRASHFMKMLALIGRTLEH